MAVRRRQGFTLIELLVVIVIIALLVALLLPAIVKALCAARQGTAEHLIDNLSQAATMYYNDVNKYPDGKGSGSRELAYALATPGAKKQSYYEFMPDMLLAGAGDIINPVFPTDGPPQGIISYRNNQAGGGSSTPTPRHTRSFDMWCAGCTFSSGDPSSTWSVNNWE